MMVARFFLAAEKHLSVSHFLIGLSIVANMIHDKATVLTQPINTVPFAPKSPKKILFAESRIGQCKM